MIRFLRAVGRALFWLSRFRPVRPLLWFIAFLWLFDSGIRLATDAAWFGSLGRLALWQHQLAWQTGVFGAFAIPTVGVSALLMRALAQPVGRAVAEPPLPRALLGWTGARAHALRWGWLALLLGIGSIGRGLSADWPDFALLGARGGSWKEAGTDFWVWHAPALDDVLGAWWRFGLWLGLVALFVGALRSLPFLAARQSVVPRNWIRAMTGIAVALFLGRAAGFGLEGARALTNLSNQGARAFAIALCAAGALGCSICVLMVIRRPRPILAVWVAGLVALPFLASLGARFSSPLADGPSLGEAAPVAQGAVPTEVPLWDEATLGRVMRAHLLTPRGGQWVAWESIGISALGSVEGTGRAEVVGEAPVADAWAGHGLAGKESAFTWLSLDLPGLLPSRRGEPLGPLFYGLNARPLLAEEARSTGVPFETWAWKMAWAWRLRDPLLLVESARAKRLLVFRGAREIGERLAPFWTWDDAIPRRDPRTGSAFFEAVAYASTTDKPRAACLESGPFAGQNAVRPVAVLRLEARSGQVHIAPFAASDRSQSNPFVARWASALPLVFDAPKQNAPTPALEQTRAGNTPLVWMQGEEGWQKRALPAELREAALKTLRNFDGLARTRKSNQGTTSPEGTTSLEGATPSLWREGSQVFLARPYFTLPVGEMPVMTSNTSDAASGFKGLCVEELGSASPGWGQILEAARADAQTSHFPVLNPPGARIEPGSAPVPYRTPVFDTGETVRQAIAAQDAALEALKAGHYVESQRQSERAHQLLEPLTRQ